MLFRESPYAETEQVSPLTLLTDVLATPFMLNYEGQTQWTGNSMLTSVPSILGILVTMHEGIGYPLTPINSIDMYRRGPEKALAEHDEYSIVFGNAIV